MFYRTLGTILGMALALPFLIGQQQKTFVDQGEADIYKSVLKAQNPAQKLIQIDSWTRIYPQTNLQQERTMFYLQTYSALTSLGLRAEATPEQVIVGTQSANMLLATAESAFAPQNKLENISDSQWASAKAQVVHLAYQGMAHTYIQQQKYAEAEAVYNKMIEANPNDAITAYQLGSAILYQRNNRAPQAIYQFARAQVLTGPEALNPQARQETDEYLTKIYIGYRGSTEGLAELKATAAQSPFPPEGWTIKRHAFASK